MAGMTTERRARQVLELLEALHEAPRAENGRDLVVDAELEDRLSDLPLLLVELTKEVSDG